MRTTPFDFERAGCVCLEQRTPPFCDQNSLFKIFLEVISVSGRKFKVLEMNKKNFTKAEREQREQAERGASEDFTLLQKTPPKSLDQIGRYEWQRVWEDISKLPVRNLDKVSLELYCSWYSMYRKALKEVEENGIYAKVMVERTVEEDGEEKTIYVEAEDKARKNPAIAVMNDASANVMKFASSLGLTVDSRMRLYMPPKDEKEKSIFDQFGEL